MFKDKKAKEDDMAKKETKEETKKEAKKETKTEAKLERSASKREEFEKELEELTAKVKEKPLTTRMRVDLMEETLQLLSKSVLELMRLL